MKVLFLFTGLLCLQNALTFFSRPRIQNTFGIFKSSAFDEDLIPCAKTDGMQCVQNDPRLAQGVAVTLQGSAMEFGVLELVGKGCLNFLNNKLTARFENASGYQQACLLNARGKIVDFVGVGLVDADHAFIVTSPGHSAKQLYDRLDPFIFSLDEVKLSMLTDVTLFTLLSTNNTNIDNSFQNYIAPILSADGLVLPTACSLTELENSGSLLILPHSLLRTYAGYTFCFFNDSGLGNTVWSKLVSNDSSLVALDSLEMERLCIESGQPSFGTEFTGHLKDATGSSTPASPLELQMEQFIDFTKGCYLGQEGIASIVKNPRGPPRLLYQVVFDNEINYNDDQSAENINTCPEVGANLYCVGLKEEILVGTVTSIAKPSGKGRKMTVGLCLARRADSILKKMKDLDMPTPKSFLHTDNVSQNNQSMHDPLHGLEVIVGGTHTTGRLMTLPSRANRMTSILGEEVKLDAKAQQRHTIEEKIELEDEERKLQKIDAMRKKAEEAIVTRSQKSKEDLMREAETARAALKKEAAGRKMIATLPAAAEKDDDSEAARKAEKMEMLRKRAEEAIARRNLKKEMKI
jgi:folate-binding Fe-S cluster repair protein YgfZ